jgi:hypothetical protein
MKEIALSQGKVALVDDEDYERVASFKWYAVFARYTFYAEAMHCESGKRIHIKMHRLILNATPGILVDHISHNGLDNRRCNLRTCTNSQNTFAMVYKPAGKSGYRGVRKDRNRWLAVIGVRGERLYLGSFETPGLAYAVYCRAARHYFGEFADSTLRLLQEAPDA